jgi:hypothetical protein
MKQQPQDTIGAVRDQAAQLLQSIIEQATARAMSESQRVTSQASRARRGPFSRSKSPTARDIALNAASGAIELWQAARERAEDSLGSVQSSVLDSAHGISQNAHDLRSAAADRAHAVSQNAQDLKSAAADRAHAVTSTVSETARKAEDTSKAVAAGTVETGRHGIGLLFWTGAAGAIAYYAFLDDDRREKVRALAMRAISEGRTLLADFQGMNGDFDAEDAGQPA